MDNKHSDIKTRKLSAAELISLAAEVCRKKFRFLAAAGLAVFIPMSVFRAILPNPLAYLKADASGLIAVGDMGGFLRAVLPVFILNAVFAPLFVGAATHVARRHVEDSHCGFPGIMDASLSKWGKLAATAILYYIITALASFMLIPGIFIAVACAFYPNVISDGGPWGFGAFRESIALVRGRWFRTCCFLMLVNIVLAVVTTLLQAALYAVFAVFMSVDSLLSPGADIFVSLALDFAGMYFTVLIALWFLNRRYLQGETEFNA